MSSQDELKARIDALLLRAEAKREEHIHAREDLMEQIGTRQLHFENVANDLIASVVRPRIEVMANAFGHAGSVVALDGGHGLAVPFAHTDEFPAHARVEVNISHDQTCEHAWCGFTATIIPILMEYERDRRLDLDLGAPDRHRLMTFIDERIEAFVVSYLSLRDSESMYQRDQSVTDPVCGMSFRRADAHSFLDHAGLRVFFCAEACRQQFEAAPERYGAGKSASRG